MNIIHIHHPFKPQHKNLQSVVLAMGFFDGVHLGHQKVLKTAQGLADQKQVPLDVLTYNIRPASFYHRFNLSDDQVITLNSAKFKIFAKLGVAKVYVIDYTSAFQAQKPRTFIENYVLKFHPKVLVAGFDHTYGPQKIANMRLLPKYVGPKIPVVTVSACEYRHRKISSTWVKESIHQGKLELTRRLLKRPFQTQARVVRGFQRGRKLGFPTINLQQNPYQIMPPLGVYVTKVQFHNQQTYIGMASIGRNPTFGDANPITVEINLLNFHQSVYGEPVKVNWYHKLRNQVKFNHVDDLIKQMQRDQRDTEAYFKKN